MKVHLHMIYDILCDDIPLNSMFKNIGLSCDFNRLSGEIIRAIIGIVDANVRGSTM